MSFTVCEKSRLAKMRKYWRHVKWISKEINYNFSKLIFQLCECCYDKNDLVFFCAFFKCFSKRFLVRKHTSPGDDITWYYKIIMCVPGFKLRGVTTTETLNSTAMSLSCVYLNSTRISWIKSTDTNCARPTRYSTM